MDRTRLVYVSGKVINKYKVSKHFELDIRDNDFSFEINQDNVKKEAALDGIYIVRTSLSKDRMDADETVRSYKLLSQAERAFRSFKTVDLMVRPIRHRLEDRVRAHIFLCMLAYYVQWHMMEAWRPLLYADEDQKAKDLRDPVAPAKRSDSAMKKVRTKRLDDGSRVHSFPQPSRPPRCDCLCHLPLLRRERYIGHFYDDHQT